jgi:hypothetical protein
MWSAVRRSYIRERRRLPTPDDLFGNMVAKTVFRKPHKIIFIAFSGQIGPFIAMKWSEETQEPSCRFRMRIFLENPPESVNILLTLILPLRLRIDPSISRTQPLAKSL